MTQPIIRFGILGASQIAPTALVAPVKSRPHLASLQAIAARDPSRAKEFATTHGIAEVAQSYDELISRNDIDAIYNGLPASHHAPWTIKALEAGKPVLCEKPFALNAEEARQMVAKAEETGLLLMEAFHYRYHPLNVKWRGLLADGVIGQPLKASGIFTVPLKDTSDIRYQYPLGGGSLMDIGTYPLHWLRDVAQIADPDREPEVISATAEDTGDRVDLSLTAKLRFGASGDAPDLEADLVSSMKGDSDFQAMLTVEGTDGKLTVINPLAPHMGNRLIVEGNGRDLNEEIKDEPTYSHQLDAFATAFHGGAQRHTLPHTMGQDSIRQMAAIDAIYDASGLGARGQ